MKKPIKASAKPEFNSLKIRKILEPMTPGQATFLDALKRSDVTLVDGIFGTGKTYMAVGHAAREVMERTTKRRKIYVARPIVQAGEDLGYLPGTLEEKADPYMIPIYEAFREFCVSEVEFENAIENETLNVTPLAFLRGRTFKDSWMILDEAQNASKKQIEMFLSRIGSNSRVIICGSADQCDLPDGPGGWIEVVDKLSGGGFRKGKVSVCHLGVEDIVRHDLIAEIFRRLNDIPEEPKGYPERDGARYASEHDVDWGDEPWAVG